MFIKKGSVPENFPVLMTGIPEKISRLHQYEDAAAG
jgi:hypothetical protein